MSTQRHLPLTGRFSGMLAFLFLASAASLWLSAPAALAADEICSSCSQEVSLSGDFTHRKDAPSVTIEGAGNNAAAFQEEVNGEHFTVTIRPLPAGRYTITIGEVETLASGPKERLFDVMSGDKVIAKDFDIFATAGAARKVCSITGVVEHEDDSIHGPLAILFVATKNKAKFNTFEVKNASGVSVLAFSASELADAFSASATRVPEVKEPPIWRDPSKPLKARADDLIRRMSLAEKVGQLQGGMSGAPGIERLGLPAYNYWNEALHGVQNNGVATVFPEPVGMASTWNPPLLRQEGGVIGVEGRAKFNDYASKHNGDTKWWYGLTFWTPNINIFRDPRWGRGQETYGEDPYLSGAIAVEFIKGIQGDDPNYMLAMACAKHYAVHSGPEADRHRFNAQPSERDLYEMYLPQFEVAVREGHVAGVMGAYNAVNGVPCCASTFLLDDLLRKQWGFEGYVVSDCDAIRDIWGPHQYAKTPEEAAAKAVKAGCNLCCGGDYNALVRAVQQGLLTEKDVDEALYYTLWTRFRLGLFDPPEKCKYSKIDLSQNDTPEHRQIALQISRESLVLLKNNGILPLDRAKVKRIAVIGPNADSVPALHGNYNGTPSHPTTILRGIREIVPDANSVTYAQGCPLTTETGRGMRRGRGAATPTRPPEELKTEALSTVGNADVIIYVGGISPDLEGEMRDRTSIELPQVQEDLIRALQATGKPLIMVNCSGSAIALTWEAENLPAILQAWYSGGDGGRAVAEVLFGQVNPSGHLPVTFYRATADMPAFTDYSFSNRTYRYFSGKPLYAFGHGLSYTKFDYSGGNVESKKMAANGTAKVTFAIKNSGGLDGDDVAQVYFRHVNSKVPQPKLVLCGFARVRVKHGESKTVTVDVPAARLRYWDTEKKQYVVEPGDYEFLVGAASDDIRLKVPMTITAQ
jgi:beta-glucosidase